MAEWGNYVPGPYGNHSYYLASNTDLESRDADIAAIWQVVQEEKLYIPLHHQVLNWGMKSGVDTIVAADDTATTPERAIRS